jgi:hypothetical protein
MIDTTTQYSHASSRFVGWIVPSIRTAGMPLLSGSASAELKRRWW